MKVPALIVAGFAATLSPALAGPETDFPHRDWGKFATLDMTATEATTCVARSAARRFERIIPIPVEGGADIDAGPGGGFFGVSHDPWVRYQIRGDGGTSTLRIYYRHPVSVRQIDKDLERFRKMCLRVRSFSVAHE